jgi:hypothetical protein
LRSRFASSDSSAIVSIWSQRTHFTLIVHLVGSCKFVSENKETPTSTNGLAESELTSLLYHESKHG